MSRENYTEYKTAVMLWEIVPPFLILFGITGNVISIVVLLKKRLRNCATSMFLATLALSDILALTSGLLRQWIKYTFHIDVRKDLTVLGCKFHWFVVYVVTQFSSWMLICVTAERVISTFIPHKRRVFCNIRYATFAVCMILCFLLILNVHYLFGYGEVSHHVGNETVIEKCIPTTENYNHFIIYSWTWIDLCVFYLIPMLVLLVGNSMIIYKVLKSRHRSRRIVVPAAIESVASQRNKTSGLTVLLMLVSALFIVCVLPIVVYPIGEPHWKQDASDHRLATLFLSETIANLLMYVNHSVNFVVYFLSGSRFRKEVNLTVCHRSTRVLATQQTTQSRPVRNVVNQV